MDRKQYYRDYNAKRKAKMAEYDQNRKEDKKLRERQYRLENPERYKTYQERNTERNSHKWSCNTDKVYQMWWAARKRATDKGLPFNIERSDVVIPEICPCCLDPIERPSLDKVKPSLGYVKGNTCVICFDCNVIKSYGDAERHRKIADYIDRFS